MAEGNNVPENEIDSGSSSLSQENENRLADQIDADLLRNTPKGSPVYEATLKTINTVREKNGQPAYKSK